MINLDTLPSPQVINEVDIDGIVEASVARLLADYPDVAGIIELETELSRIVVNTCAYREGLLRGAINDAARANLLHFAQQGDLDHLAAFYDVTRLGGEDDDRLKERVVLAIQGRSPGGTRERYQSIAMTADIRVAAVYVWSEGRDPTVKVSVMSSDNGGVADQALLDVVEAALSAPDKRLVNDRFELMSAVSETIDIEADVWMLPNTAQTVFDGLEAGLRAAHTAENGLGFDLTRSWLNARLMTAGVQRVEVLQPLEDVIVEPTRAVTLGTVTLNHRGTAF